LKGSTYAFGHGAEHILPNGRTVFDSYHCSRYNTQTRRLTGEMFRDVVGRASARAWKGKGIGDRG
jgi:uracil-DNA glycosylase